MKDGEMGMMGYMTVVWADDDDCGWDAAVLLERDLVAGDRVGFGLAGDRGEMSAMLLPDRARFVVMVDGIRRLHRDVVWPMPPRAGERVHLAMGYTAGTGLALECRVHGRQEDRGTREQTTVVCPGAGAMQPYVVNLQFAESWVQGLGQDVTPLGVADYLRCWSR
jgi:hypothetical protein